MKHEQIEIIKKLIKNRFDIDNFKNFAARVLNVRVGNRNESEAIWKEYQDYIESYFSVSDYRDKDDKKIYILAVKIKDYYIKNGEKLKIDPTRARTKQRNFIATMLKKYSKHGALVAFYNEVRTDWRLSFVKLDYSFTSEGIQEKFTPSKRASYLVGEGEASHTVIKQFSQLIGNAEEGSLSQLENLFQLEKVTDEFFDEYKNKYLDLKLYLEENEIFKSEAIKHTANIEQFSEEFSKKLMGQLAFLYFLQKKGWLGVKIVPQKIESKRFKEIYGKSSPNGKELLDKVYKGVSQEEFKLTSEVNSKEINSDILAECFKNTEFDEPWGSGEQKFIRTLFDRHIEINEKRKETGKEELNFFNDYLEHFFYEALNQNRGENQYFPKFNCKIPFLNGGLFEPFDGYDWENTDFKIPDEMFSNKDEKGILDVFDRFNFTIAENEPFETEVAVDPEMLGKVFENLLDVKDRKSKGAFYTPREIVHYMCKESLTNYLANEVTEVKKEEIEQLLQLGEFTKDYDTHIFEMEYKHGKNDNELGLPKSLFENIDKIDNAIQNVKIADPAIGSGAFPLGMLNEIVKVRNIITEYMLMSQYFRYKKVNELENYWDFEDKLRKQRSLYNLKIETIENSLFGVDIEPSAVEIAKLRLWLSIVVDTTNENIQPLPNLDFNFMTGNSLLDEFEGIKLFDEKFLNKEYSTKEIGKIRTGFQLGLFGGIENVQEDIIGNITKLHKQFFAEKNTVEKKKIKSKIEQLEWTLIEVTLRNSGNENSKIKELEKLQKEKRKPYFLWKLEFAEVFQEKGGFDIVIGNPPYVGEKGNKEIFRPIAESSLGKRFYQGKVDLFYFFFHLGLDLSKNKGTISLITTNYYITADGAKKLREDFYNRSNILKLINFNEIIIFETAKGQHNLITIIEKSTKKDVVGKTIVCNSKNGISIKEINDVLYKKSAKAKYYNINQNEFYIGENLYIKLEHDEMDIILDRLLVGTKIKELYNVNQGIVSGADKFTDSHKLKYKLEYEKGMGIFVVNPVEAINLERNLLGEFFKNSDIKRYYCNTISDKRIIYTDKFTEIEKYPLIYSHLKNFKIILESKRESQQGKLPWFSLHWGRDKKIFISEKIIAPQRSYINSFAYNKAEWFSSADVYYITYISDKKILLKYTLALLNSKLYYMWLYKRGKRKGEMLELYATPLEQIPIKEVGIDIQNKFIEIVDRIIEMKETNKDTTDLENQIDEMVYDLYELTEEEKDVVRSFGR